MARVKTALHWKIRAMEIYHNAPEPKPGRKRLAEQLARDFEPDDTGPPKERLVGHFIKEYKALTADDRREYEHFAWPASMEAGLLPWEASRDLLDLLRDHPRVVIPAARWYWRACQAMPDASIKDRLAVAGALGGRASPKWSQSSEEALQRYLVFQPWQPAATAERDYEKDEKDYEAAVEAERLQSRRVVEQVARGEPRKEEKREYDGK